MNASLPMYDWPEMRRATDALWSALAAALADRGIGAPATLDRDTDRYVQWRDPGLVLSQTCGYPYATSLRGDLRLLAIPVYTAPGCSGPSYRSAVLVRAEDSAYGVVGLRGRRVVYNGSDSQSGYSSLRALVAPFARNGRFFAHGIESGSHRASMEAVAAGYADCASIDCVTWAMAEHCRGDLATRLRVVAWGPPAPSLPFVTSAARPEAEIEAIRDALFATIADPATAGIRHDLLLAGLEPVADAAYDVVLSMERHAADLGYPQLT